MTNFDNIPQEMKDLPQWVCWKREKDTKILYDAKMINVRASSTDPKTWSDFDHARRCFKQDSYADGIGFVFTKASGIMGIDIDHIDTEERETMMRQIVDIFDSYTEVSPSGKGVHIYIKAQKNTTKCKDSKLGLEFYDEKRFFTVTGNIMGINTTINPRQEQLNEFEKKYFAEKILPKKTVQETPTMDDQKIIDLMFSAKNGYKAQEVYYGRAEYGSESERDGALASIISYWTQDPDQIERIMRTSSIHRDKWDRGDDYLQKFHIATALNKLTETYTPPIEFDIREMTPVVVGSDEKQVSKLIMKTKDGQQKVVKKMSDLTVDDFEEILEHLGYKFKLNKMDDSIVVNKDEYTDVYMGVIAGKLDSLGLTNKKRIDNKIWEIAFRHRFHPIKDYLEGLRWDGKDHIGEVSKYITDEEGLFGFYFKKWIVGAVAKIYVKTDNKVFILNGKQDMGKSFFAKWIGQVLDDERFFSDKDMNANDKDSQLKLAQRWIWELSELTGVVGKSALGNVKQFLTLEDIEVRPAFGHKMIRKPAITSFLGTFNDSSGFLNDPTGSRRFISCTVSKIDRRYSENIDPSQVWAQAYHLYKVDKFSWKFSEEETIMSEKNNQKYVVQDPLDDFLHKYFDFTDENARLGAEDVRKHIEDMAWKGDPSKYMMKVGIYFRKRGAIKREGTAGNFYQGVSKKTI